MTQSQFVAGAGLGLRSEHLEQLCDHIPETIDFFEIAPENWLEMGGKRGKALKIIANQRPIATHGLSLSLGSPAPLDENFLVRVKRFLDDFQIELYTEHLSWCGDEGHLYDLFPIPFTEEAAEYVAGRIRRTQEILERSIAVENASFYVFPPQSEMNETDFINRVMELSGCDLHLDVNNVYVNSQNFGFDPWQFIDAFPKERIRYIHVAGHYIEPDGLIIDTHGSDVIDPVWSLLDKTYKKFGVIPTLLERDFNIPPLDELLPQVEIIHHLQSQYRQVRHERAA